MFSVKMVKGIPALPLRLLLHLLPLLRRLPPLSPHKPWDERFPVARELDRCPTTHGIRVGLNNRLGVTSSSFSTSRRFDSMVQRYAMLGPHAVY